MAEAAARDLEVCSSEIAALAAHARGSSYNTLTTTRQDSSESSRSNEFVQAVSDENSPFMSPGPDGRYACLDVVRIMCIWLVCVDHAGTTFGAWNTMYVQSWVLQYLFYICGFCYAMTSKSILAYLGRLILFFVIGTCLNFSGWLLTGKDWRNDVFGVVFQFWFLWGLICYLAMLTPLKWYLKDLTGKVQAVTRGAARDAEAVVVPQFSQEMPWRDVGMGCLSMVVGCLIIKLTCEFALIPITKDLLAGPLMPVLTRVGEASEFWGLPNGKDKDESAAFIQSFLGDAELTVSNLFIAVIFPAISKRRDLTMWIVLLNTYSHKCVFYRAEETRCLNGFDYTLLGLLFYHLGLAGRRVIGEYIVRYWFLFLLGCSLLWTPGLYGRFDESPPASLSIRMAYNSQECCFAIAFFCAIERVVDPKIFTHDRLSFLGNWALLIFLTHKFLNVTLSSLPSQALARWLYFGLLLALIPICWALSGPERDSPAQAHLARPPSSKRALSSTDTFK